MSKLLRIALTQLGTVEIRGEEHNPQILKYFQETGHSWVKNDEMAWCSAFVNWCALKAGLQGSGKLNARSWLDVGVALDVTEVEAGEVVIFWRSSPKSWKGHVGIYIDHDDKYVYTLGGNQNNMVRVSAYPIDRVLGYRTLRQA